MVDIPQSRGDREQKKFGKADDKTAVNIRQLGSFAPPDYDEALLSYTGNNLTGVVYKLETVTVRTVVLEYTGNQLTRITKS